MLLSLLRIESLMKPESGGGSDDDDKIIYRLLPAAPSFGQFDHLGANTTFAGHLRRPERRKSGKFSSRPISEFPMTSGRHEFVWRHQQQSLHVKTNFLMPFQVKFAMTAHLDGKVQRFAIPTSSKFKLRFNLNFVAAETLKRL